MEISKLFGLPAHPLLVHIPVVLLPLVALGTIAITVRPALRERFGWLVLAGAGVVVVAVQLALGSGEALEPHVERSALLHRHTQLADSMRPLAIVLFVLVLAVVLLGRLEMPPPRRWIVPAVGVLAVLGSLVTTARLVQVGHAGAKATWHDTDMSKKRGGHGDAESLRGGR
jgi:hypothetical protein